MGPHGLLAGGAGGWKRQPPGLWCPYEPIQSVLAAAHALACNPISLLVSAAVGVCERAAPVGLKETRRDLAAQLRAARRRGCRRCVTVWRTAAALRLPSRRAGGRMVKVWPTAMTPLGSLLR